MRKTAVARFATILMILLLGGCSFQGAIDTETATVRRVIDGDTCRLEDGRRVRYLGINAPETGDPHAKEATLANERLVGGKTVRLEFDRSRQDQYDRLLAYVFAGDTFVNETLLRQGLVHLRHPVAEKYRERLCQAQGEARTAGAGIWAPAAGGRSIALAFVHANAKGDDRQNLNDEFIVVENRGQDPVDLSGWAVSDAANQRYLFSNFTLAPQATVTLRTGLGTSTERELFWGSRKPIWNNQGDTIFIRDSWGQLVLSHVYGDEACHTKNNLAGVSVPALAADFQRLVQKLRVSIAKFVAIVLLPTHLRYLAPYLTPRSNAASSTASVSVGRQPATNLSTRVLNQRRRGAVRLRSID